MSLGPGTRLGPYEIQAAIGAGGIGEVYRATDTSDLKPANIKLRREGTTRTVNIESYLALGAWDLGRGIGISFYSRGITALSSEVR
jgi:serine/threonine protein kinase